MATPDQDGIQEYYSFLLRAKTCVATRREVHLLRMVFNYRIAVTVDPMGMYYEEEYCYKDPLLAVLAFVDWDGEAEPQGWIKRVGT